jgi:hypothetical protein
MKFVYGQDKKEIIKNVSYDKLPEDLEKENLWFHAVLLNDKKNNIKFMCGSYVNKYYESGEIVISNKIFNDFPVAQSAWNNESQINRMYVDPNYRNKRVAKYSVISNDMMAQYLGEEPWSIIYTEKMGGTPAGDQLYNSIYDLGFENVNVKINPMDIFDYRNYCFPIIYFDKRVVYVENNSQ